MAVSIVLSVDYEVFGDGSGCHDACMVQPATRMLGLGARANVPFTWFVEPLELIAFSRTGSGASRSVASIVAQLKDFQGAGHEIALHLHPQWLGAALGRTGARSWDPAAWRFGDLDNASQVAALRLGMDWLGERLSSAAGWTAPLAFRAGGWGIQPEGRAAQALSRVGIRIDSSIAPGACMLGGAAWFDFRRQPRRSMWPLPTAGAATPRERILEVPIATGLRSMPTRLSTKARSLLERRLQPAAQAHCRGSSLSVDPSLRKHILSVLSLLASKAIMADFCRLTAPDLAMLVREWTDLPRNLSGSRSAPAVLVGHTKTYDVRAETELAAFVEDAPATLDTRFTTFAHWLKETGSEVFGG